MTDNSPDSTASEPAEGNFSNQRRARSRDVQDARPLLQAICLGIFLAAILTGAAALAGPDKDVKTLLKSGMPAASAPASNNTAPPDEMTHRPFVDPDQGHSHLEAER